MESLYKEFDLVLCICRGSLKLQCSLLGDSDTQIQLLHSLKPLTGEEGCQSQTILDEITATFFLLHCFKVCLFSVLKVFNPCYHGIIFYFMWNRR